MQAILILIIMIIAPWILLATILWTLWAILFGKSEEEIERSKKQKRRRNESVSDIKNCITISETRNVNQQPKRLDPEDVKTLEEGTRNDNQQPKPFGFYTNIDRRSETKKDNQ